MSAQDGPKTFAPQLRRDPSEAGHLVRAPVAAEANGKDGDQPQLTIVDFLPPDQVATEEQKRHLRVASKRAKQGPASRTPMICKGISCPFLGYCDLANAGMNLPIGALCPIELFVIEEAKQSLIAATQIDEKDPGAYFIVQICYDLAVDAAMQSRILQNLGEDPELIQSTFGGFDADGNALEIKKLNPLIDLHIRTGNMKMKRLIQLLATPKSKAEAGRLGYDDPSSQAADAQARAAKLKELVEGASYERDMRIPQKQYQKLEGGEDDPLMRLEKPIGPPSEEG